PLERSVFVLREVFGFGFDDIAATVGRSEAACRQLLVRARRHMEAGRPRFEADRGERQELARRFFDALREGDVAGLRDLLAAGVQLVGAGGGKAPQLARAVVGAEHVARLLASVFPVLARIEVTCEPHEVNGQPGAIFRDRDGKVLHTLALDVLDGQIQTIRSVINPDKLGHLGPVADAWATAGGHGPVQSAPRAAPRRRTVPGVQAEAVVTAESQRNASGSVKSPAWPWRVMRCEPVPSSDTPASLARPRRL